MSSLLLINPNEEIHKIIDFIENTLHKANKQKVIIAVSGGIDSATSLNVINEVVPVRKIFVAHLYYFESTIIPFKKTIAPLGIPEQNVLLYSIKYQVDTLAKELGLEIPQNETEQIRYGNIMARVRMIMLYDFAKKYNALVCGTENRSEYHLGYYTRFGDAASDFEPLHHLYKSQVRQLAAHFNVPESILKAAPAAGLWENQTDEKEFGFTYEEADPVLYLYFEEKRTLQEIKARGYNNVKEIIEMAMKNNFKKEVPYLL